MLKPTKKIMQTGDSVVLETFDNVGSALVLKALLDSEGIFCLISGEETINLHPVFGDNAQGVKLMIHQTDLERAKLLLDSARQNTGETEQYTISCPVCGSENVSPSLIKPGFLPSLIDFFKTTFLRKNTMFLHCNSCGADFE